MMVESVGAAVLTNQTQGFDPSVTLLFSCNYYQGRSGEAHPCLEQRGNTGCNIQHLLCPILWEEHLRVESLTSLCLVNETLVLEGKLGRLLS